MKTYLNQMFLISIISLMPQIFGAHLPLLEAQYTNIEEEIGEIIEEEIGEYSFSIKNYEAKLAIALETKNFSRLAKLSYKISQKIDMRRKYKIDPVSKFFIYLLREIMEADIETLKNEIIEPILFSAFSDKIEKAYSVAHLLINNYYKSKPIHRKEIAEINDLINVQELLELFVREKQFIFIEALYNLELIETEQILEATQSFYIEIHDQFLRKLKDLKLSILDYQQIVEDVNINIKNTNKINLNRVSDRMIHLADEQFVKFKCNILPFERYKIFLTVLGILKTLEELRVLYEEFDDLIEEQ